MKDLQVLVVNSGGLHEIKGISGVNITASVERPQDALSILHNIPIDIVVTYLNIPTNDTYELLESINLMKIKPIVSVITELIDEEYSNMARRLGAKFVFKSTPFDEAIKQIYHSVRGKTEEIVVVKTVSDKVLDERLANIFIASGIPPHIKGYQFLREAVKQSVRVPSMINNITKQLYPAIAQKFNTSPSKVERAIRHAIEVAWQRGKIENINSIYGIKVFSKGEKPTNGELIALVSDKMIIELVN
jgi:two-component system response regulator (stage 0 sporulation protein A)